MVDLHPRAVIIWGMDNDVGIRAPRAGIAQACWGVERNLESLVRLAARARHRANPGHRPDASAAVPLVRVGGCLAGRIRGKEGRRAAPSTVTCCASTRSSATSQRTGTRLLDLHPLVSARNGMRARRYARPDGSHLTDAGYRVINGYAIPRLEEWLAAWDRPRPARRSSASPAAERQKRNGRCPLRSTGRWNCEQRPRRAVVGTRQNVTRVTICSERGAATPLTAPNPVRSSDVPLVPGEVGDRRVGQVGEVRRAVEAGELRVVEGVERVDAELELQALRTGEDLRQREVEVVDRRAAHEEARRLGSVAARLRLRKHDVLNCGTGSLP